LNERNNVGSYYCAGRGNCNADSFYALIGIKIEFYQIVMLLSVVTNHVPRVEDFFEKFPSFERFWGDAKNESKNETTNNAIALVF
jgi:hypothetical protein